MMIERGQREKRKREGNEAKKDKQKRRENSEKNKTHSITYAYHTTWKLIVIYQHCDSCDTLKRMKGFERQRDWHWTLSKKKVLKNLKLDKKADN